MSWAVMRAGVVVDGRPVVNISGVVFFAERIFEYDERTPDMVTFAFGKCDVRYDLNQLITDCAKVMGYTLFSYVVQYS